MEEDFRAAEIVAKIAPPIQGNFKAKDEKRQLNTGQNRSLVSNFCVSSGSIILTVLK